MKCDYCLNIKLLDICRMLTSSGVVQNTKGLIDTVLLYSSMSSLVWIGAITEVELMLS